MLLFSMKPRGLWQSLLHSQKHPKTDILLKEELRNNHLECINLVNNGKNYLTIGAGILNHQQTVAPENRPRAPKRLSSSHQFSGANCWFQGG